jgi:long-chain acyl-CoA synthetase
MSQPPLARQGRYPALVDWRTPVAASHVCDLLDAAAAAYPDRTHLEFEGRRIGYAESAWRVSAIAATLAAHGVRRGDVVALYCANSPWHLLTVFAVLRLGAVVTHLTPLDAPRELRFKLQDTGARTLVTLATEPLMTSALGLADAGLLDRIFVGDDSVWNGSTPATPVTARVIDLAAAAETPTPALATSQGEPGDVAVIQYTGGTTGAPKGAMLTHANLTSAVSQFNRWMSAEPYWNPAGERHLMVLPGFHIYALVAILLRATGRGDTIHLRARFDAAQALADLAAHQISWFFAVPTMLVAMAADPGIEDHDLSALTFCVAGGAPLPAEVGARFHRLTGLPVGVGWGMTETAGAGTMTPTAGAAPGCVGLPLPNVEVEIVDMDDPHRRLGPGQTGELRIRGPNVFAGYWRRPEETAAAFADGFLLTGDVGFADETGCIFLVDRKKDLIISGGFNVYPRIVEEAIYEHPAVEEVVVYGVVDAYRGEAAKAAIKLRAGHAAFSLEELRAFLADKLGRHELPAALAFHDALPRTAVGKLSRKDLAAAERS